MREIIILVDFKSNLDCVVLNLFTAFYHSLRQMLILKCILGFSEKIDTHFVIGLLLEVHLSAILKVSYELVR